MSGRTKGSARPSDIRHASLDPSRPFWELTSKAAKLTLFFSFLFSEDCSPDLIFRRHGVSNTDRRLRWPWKVLEGMECTWASDHSLISFLCFPTQLQGTRVPLSRVCIVWMLSLNSLTKGLSHFSDLHVPVVGAFQTESGFWSES